MKETEGEKRRRKVDVEERFSKWVEGEMWGRDSPQLKVQVHASVLKTKGSHLL